MCFNIIIINMGEGKLSNSNFKGVSLLKINKLLDYVLTPALCINALTK